MRNTKKSPRNPNIDVNREYFRPSLYVPFCYEAPGFSLRQNLDFPNSQHPRNVARKIVGTSSELPMKLQKLRYR